MVYRLGQRVRPGFRTMKIVSLGLLSILLLGTLATAYANSHGTHLPTHPAHQGKHSVVSKNLSQGSKSANSTGSAHKAAVGSTTPAVGLPALAGLRTASCTLFPSGSPGLANAISPELRKLAQYEQLCNGALVGRDSFFVPTTTK